MATVKPGRANEHLLQTYAMELQSEQAYRSGDYASAADSMQRFMDRGAMTADDKAWYLQEMARYYYKSNRPESQRLQVAAHKENRILLRPPTGVTVAKLTQISQGRMERIAEWIRQFENYPLLNVAVSEILGRMVFGAKADGFEQALDEVSRALGFSGERPDKEWKEGPDNLWALDDTQYILWECKNEVDINRAEINKRETEQMNRSSAWFEKHYQGMKVTRIIVHPSNVEASAASFTHDVEAMRETELKRLMKRLGEFYKSFEYLNFKDLSTGHIQKLVDAHSLSITALQTAYTKKLRRIV